jgi:hypothetical protein
MRTEALVTALPSLMDSLDFSELFAEQVDLKEQDMTLFRRCLARQLWRKRCGNALHVARPLGMTNHWEMFRQVFPKSKILVLARKPADCLASLTQLWAYVIGESDIESSVRLQKAMNCTYHLSSERMFKTILKLAQNPPENVYMVHFDEWINDPAAILKSCFGVLGLGQMVLIPAREETHKKNPRARQLVPVSPSLVLDFDEYFAQRAKCYKLLEEKSNIWGEGGKSQ